MIKLYRSNPWRRQSRVLERILHIAVTVTVWFVLILMLGGCDEAASLSRGKQTTSSTNDRSPARAPRLVYLRAWEFTSSSRTEVFATNLAVDNIQRILVPVSQIPDNLNDGLSASIKLFRSDGILDAELKGLQSIGGIGVDSAGNIYVAEIRPRAGITKFSSSYSRSQTWGVELARHLNFPAALTVNNGGIYVADKGTGCIHKISINGTYEGQFPIPTGITAPPIVIGQDGVGNIWAGYGTVLVQSDNYGNVKAAIDIGPDIPFAIAPASGDNILVSTSEGNILIVGLSGRYSVPFDRHHRTALGLCINEKNEVFIYDPLSFSVIAYRLEKTR